MPLVITETALIRIGELSQDGAANWRIVLFQNDYDPLIDSEWADLDEADFDGYARATPAFGAWGVAGDTASSEADAVQFIHDGGGTPNDVYGWALIDIAPATPELWALDRFSGAPLRMEFNGDTIVVQLTETVRQDS